MAVKPLTDDEIITQLRQLVGEGDQTKNRPSLDPLLGEEILGRYDALFAEFGFVRRTADPVAEQCVRWDRRDRYYYGRCAVPGDRYAWFITLDDRGFVIAHFHSGWAGPSYNDVLYHGIIPPDGALLRQLLPNLYGSAELFGPASYAPQEHGRPAGSAAPPETSNV